MPWVNVRRVVAAAVVVLCCVSSAWAAPTGPLPAISGEVHYSTFADGWVTEALTPSQIAGLTSGSGAVHVVSEAWNPLGDGDYREVPDPKVVLWFDASQLADGSAITLDVAAIGSRSPANIIGSGSLIHCEIYAPDSMYAGWFPDVVSWDTAVSADATFTLSAPGSGWPCYFVTDSMTIGIRLTGGSNVSGSVSILDEESFSMLDVSQITITGELVPEPATLGLLGTGLAAMAIRRRRQRASR